MATEKFKALVHFMVEECKTEPAKLGATRLNKALWFADVVSFKLNGVSITGDKYVKRQNGPVPLHILETLRQLEREGKIKIREPEQQFDVRKFFSLDAPNTDALSENEKALAQSVLEAVCSHSATAISEMSHDVIWHVARIGEEIPLYATLAAVEGEITDESLAWADAQIEEIEQQAA